MHGLLPHLATVVQACRMAAKVSVMDIASIARVDPSTVYRFERGRAWPRDPDVLLAAYGTIEDCHPSVLWQRALNRWLKAEGVDA